MLQAYASRGQLVQAISWHPPLAVELGGSPSAFTIIRLATRSNLRRANSYVQYARKLQTEAAVSMSDVSTRATTSCEKIPVPSSSSLPTADYFGGTSSAAARQKSSTDAGRYPPALSSWDGCASTGCLREAHLERSGDPHRGSSSDRRSAA